MNTEEIYDEKIAPLLREAAKLCEENKISLIAQVEYLPEHFGLTCSLQDNASIAMKMLLWLARAKTNIDVFMMAVSKYSMGKNHSSFVLHLMDKSYDR